MPRPKHLIQTPFDNELFTELLTGTIASRVAYEKASLCPCRAERTGPDPRCAVCSGRGFTYDIAVNVRAGITSVQHRREFGDHVIDDADAQVTVARYQEDHVTLNPAWDAAEGDRFSLVDVQRRESHHVQRRGASDRLKYRTFTHLELRSVVNDAVHTWEEGVDYSVDANVITWEAGRGPTQGTYYAVTMHANPEYHVFRDLPQLRHMDSLDLPRRFALKIGEYAP